MGAYENFERLENSLVSFCNKSYLGAWDDAQKWKENASALISKTFSGMYKKDELLKELGCLFVAAPSYAMILPAGESYSQPMSKEVEQQMFEESVKTAKHLLEKCFEELARLSNL